MARLFAASLANSAVSREPNLTKAENMPYGEGVGLIITATTVPNSLKTLATSKSETPHGKSPTQSVLSSSVDVPFKSVKLSARAPASNVGGLSGNNAMFDNKLAGGSSPTLAQLGATNRIGVLGEGAGAGAGADAGLAGAETTTSAVHVAPGVLATGRGGSGLFGAGAGGGGHLDFGRGGELIAGFSASTLACRPLCRSEAQLQTTGSPSTVIVPCWEACIACSAPALDAN